MAMPRLSEGAIANILQGDTSSKPTLQVINIRPINTANGPPRYRLLMSDGLNTLSSFMLATQLNSLVDDNLLATNCICQVSRYIVNNLKDGRRVIIVMEMEVLKPADAVMGKIGNPVPYNDGQGQPQPTAPAPAPAPPPSKSLNNSGLCADKFDGSRQPVVAIKGARLSDFGGRSLSVLSSSTIMINPDIPEAFKLRGWFDSEGQVVEGTSISEQRGGGIGGGSTNWKSLLEVKTENMGHGDKADYFTSVATIVYLRKENCLYQACASQDCNKKVIDQQNGLFRCEKCDKEFPNFKYRLILSVIIPSKSEGLKPTTVHLSGIAINSLLACGSERFRPGTSSKQK
ncbi:replication protein A 70 kDa DNA-binding subunit [Bombina bombina]|uniref:replication protein A 70 kDa DNA-binding subunit n=1 Tax=Bombina bombina TaxID=8345 RepID=UPI00235A94FB|nr:replication protein A 70 kDa DNA-binding subunit [Bombina bombina]